MIELTRKQFREAVHRANEKWLEYAKSPDDTDDGWLDSTLSFQNLAFGWLLADVLFGSDDNNDCENEEDK